MTAAPVNSPGDVNSDIPTAVNTLSPYQKAVLAWLLRHYRESEAVNSENPPAVNHPYRRWPAHSYGVPRWARKPGTPRSVSASRARAIRRLEERGLIRRHNQMSGSPGPGNTYVTQMRTTHLFLTPAGRALAEELDRAEEAS
jgi:hypothetical protein